MCTTLRFLEPTILLHIQGLSKFTYLVNRAPLWESVKDEGLVGRWLRIRKRFIWLLGADGDAVARAMGASEEGGLTQQSSWTLWKRKVTVTSLTVSHLLAISNANSQLCIQLGA